MSTYVRTTTSADGSSTYRYGSRNTKVGGRYPASSYVCRIYNVSPYGDNPIAFGEPADNPLYVSTYNKAYAKFVGSCRTKADMMANLLELGSTIDTVASAAQSAAKAFGSVSSGIRALKHGDPKGAARAFRKAKEAVGAGSLKQFNDTASGAILAINWGLSPLIADVTNSLNNKTRQAALNGTRVRARVTNEATKVNVTNSGYNIDSTHNRCTVSITGRVLVDNPTLYQLASTGLTNPLATAWELCPYSFVVDWFCNVGDIISSLTDTQGLRFEDLCITGMTRTKTSCTRYGGYFYQMSAVVLRREVGGPLPPPRLEFSSPFTSVQRLLNQVAFLVTQTKTLRN